MKQHDRAGGGPQARSTGSVAGLEVLTRGLIRWSARLAPAELTERLEEEWLADLAARRGLIPRLLFAFGCCWASRVIAHELGARVGVASVSGRKSVTLYAQPSPFLLSPRVSAFLLILCLHGVVIYALASGLVPRLASVTAQPLKAIFLPTQRPVVVVPPLAPPTLKSFRLEPEPAPDTRLDVPTDVPAPDNLTSPPVGLLTQPVESTAPARVNRVGGGPGAGFPTTEDYYPAASRRLAENGAATVRVCVDGSGRLSAAPTIAESSGSARLDAGALRLAKAGSGHYRPTTEDGRPVESCYPFRVRFRFKE